MTAAGGVGSGARHRTRHRSRRLVGLGVADVLLLSLIVVAAAVVAVGGARQVVAAPTGTQTFAHVASAQPFVVPAGVTEIFVDLSGAQGGNAFGSSQRGGFGAEVVARVPVTPGETLKLYVGSQPTSRPSGGYNGGGQGGRWTNSGGGGGGATDIRRGPGYGLSDRLVVAGAGGGAGTYTPGGAGGTDSGGAGGAPNGQNGFPGSGVGSPAPGYGATQVAGGAPGGTLAPSCSTGAPAQAGTFGVGGAAQTGSSSCNGGGAGGGGGGWYGGGGAQGKGANGSGGGGGSSYVDAASVLLVAYPGVRQGNGTAVISWGQAIPVGGAYTTAETLGGGACGGAEVQSDVGEPANTANGNFWHTFTDLTIPGRGPSIGLHRTYNAADAATMGRFGYGWTSPFDTSITVSASSATVRRGNGSRVTFTKDGLGNWFAPPRADSTMVAGPSGTWVVTCNARTILTFDSNGRLISHVDDRLSVEQPDRAAR